MPKYTTRGFPYADRLDPADIGYWGQQLGEAIGLEMDDLALSDTGVVDLLPTTVVLAGWSVATCSGRRRNGIAQVHVSFSRTGGALAAAANGNVANVDIAVLPAGWRPLIPAPAAVTSSGFILGAFVWTSGNVGIGAFPPNIPIGTGDGFTLGALFLA